MKFDPFIVLVALATLVALFAFQRRGTAVVGRWFGPVMGAWFLCLALVGVCRVAQYPRVLHALSPVWAIELVVVRPGITFVILGAVILALTDAEALYADIGHFGRRPIRIAWLAIMFPSIIIGYSGQGATLLFQPGSSQQLFFYAAPHWAVVATVVLALLATIIVSQAVMSGAFSMTSQAIELVFFPRLRVIETSHVQRNQAYVPAVNVILFAAVMFLVVAFRSSARPASAYGIAVCLMMLITTIQLIALPRSVWHWPKPAVAGVSEPLLIIDGMLVAANPPKISHGRWFPVAVGIVLFVLTNTWRYGRRTARRHSDAAQSLQAFLHEALGAAEPLARGQGTAVYPGNLPDRTPDTLRSNVRHNSVLHQTSILFTDLPESVPHVDDRTRIDRRDLGHGCYEVVARHGFVERPNLPRLLESLNDRLGDCRFDAKHTTFFLPREEIIKDEAHDAPRGWREALFAQMSFHSTSSAEYYGLRAEDVVELGVQVAL